MAQLSSSAQGGDSPTLRSIQHSVARPLPGATLRVLSLMCCGMFAWLVLGKVDIIAEAPGKLVPKTFVKVVQPQDAGVLTEVLVAEGDAVKEGQVLARLDPVTATSDQSSTKSELQQADLQVRRIDAELNGEPFAPLQRTGLPLRRKPWPSTPLAELSSSSSWPPNRQDWASLNPTYRQQRQFCPD